MLIYSRNEEIALESFVEKNNLGIIYKNYSIKDMTTLKCGGLARYVFEPKNNKSLIYFLKNNNLPYYVFGLGSNILASSKEYNGVIINIAKMLEWYLIKDDLLYISSSFSLLKISRILAEKKYGNLEFYGSIPGTIGGAIIMNAGAFSHDTKEYLKEIVVLDNGKIKKISKEDIKFSYRKSNLKGIIILSAVFFIKKVSYNPFEVIKKHQMIRKESQPLGLPSCGSVFKNPKNNYAWELIDSANLRGFKINGVEISNKHANFIITNNACGEDVLELIMLVTYKVYKKTGIFLENEVILFNFQVD